MFTNLNDSAAAMQLESCSWILHENTEQNTTFNIIGENSTSFSPSKKNVDMLSTKQTPFLQKLFMKPKLDVHKQIVDPHFFTVASRYEFQPFPLERFHVTSIWLSAVVINSDAYINTFREYLDILKQEISEKIT